MILVLCISIIIFLPLNIVGMEVPKYTVLLGKFHNQDLGTSIGLRLDVWSAKTCTSMEVFFLLKNEDNKILPNLKEPKS